MRGQVGALIALGAGFNPVLSGRENILTNASVLGLGKKETDEKLEEIIDFSEINEFIDSPVQTYSSGMQVRLGFAVATALNPDILILDEVLAVGDAKFRSKCWKRLGDILTGCCAILVSHEAYAISRICDTAMLMRNGSSTGLLATQDALSEYEQEQGTGEFERNEIHTGSEEVEMFNLFGDSEIKQGETLRLSLKLKARNTLTLDHIMINIYSNSGEIVAQALPSPTQLPSGFSNIEIEIESLMLPSGSYGVVLLASADGGKRPIIHSRDEMVFQVLGHCSYGPNYYPRSTFKAIGKTSVTLK